MSDCAPPPMPARTAAEKAAMMAEVEDRVHAEVRRAGYAGADEEDMCQDVRFELLKVIDRFDPARKPVTKWPTFVVGVARTVIRRKRSYSCERLSHVNQAVGAGVGFGGTDRDESWQFAAPGLSPLDQLIAREEAEAGEADDGTFDAIHRAVRVAAHDHLLQTLTPAFRRLVELVVIDGLKPEQVAEQIGQPLKAVRTNLLNAGKMLAAAKLTGGRSPASMARQARNARSAAREGEAATRAT